MMDKNTLPISVMMNSSMLVKEDQRDGFDYSVCGNYTKEYEELYKAYEYWCEGILFSSLGIFGLVSNIASIVTLLSVDMRKQTFNQLLAILAAVDILYIITNVPVHTAATLAIVNSWFTMSTTLSELYVYILYPMSTVSFCASIYMTLAVTVERYIAVCRPHQYRTISQTMSNSKRLLVYVVPVTAISFALNIPKFMEVKLTQTNESTINLEASDTRKNPTYIFWYTLSLIWHPTMTTGILPFIALSYMNLHIFLKIRQSRQILSGRQNEKRQSEFNLAITLLSIVFMHILCNALRVFLGVLVVALVDIQVTCIEDKESYIPPLWVMCLESVGHLLVMINFSSNFLIYCSVSNQFKAALSKLCRFLCHHALAHEELAPVENSKSKYQSLSPVPNTVSATATLEMVEQGGGCNPRSTNSCQNMKDNSSSNDSKSDSKTEVRLEMRSE